MKSLKNTCLGIVVLWPATLQKIENLHGYLSMTGSEPVCGKQLFSCERYDVKVKDVILHVSLNSGVLKIAKSLQEV